MASRLDVAQDKLLQLLDFLLLLRGATNHLSIPTTDVLDLYEKS